MHKNALRVMALVLICLANHVHAEATRGFDYVVINGVRISFGTIVEVSGPCLGPAYDELGCGATTLRLLRLDGRANQDDFKVHLEPSDANNVFSYEWLRALDHGKSYKARGRLVFARVVGSERALGLLVDRVEPMPPSRLGFADYVDRGATFDGTAGARGQFQTEDGAAQVEGVTAWPLSDEGKKIMVRGVVRRAAGGWRLERPRWRLVELAAHLGQNVSLEGIVWSSNGKWWFRCRDDDLYLTAASGPNLSLPDDDHGRRARVTGQLVRQDRPSIKGINNGFVTELVPCFVVRGAKVECLEESADWDSRYGPIRCSFHTVRDGVAELLAESNPRRYPLGNETEARLYRERNSEVIDEILRRATPETREVLARRMDDATLPDPLRLLYAGMLLSLDDARGRSFLLSRADPDGPPSIDALFCLAAFLSDAPAKSDIRWAEPALTALMTSKVLAHPERFAPYSEAADHLWVFGIDPQTFTVADAAAQFSDIPGVLLKMGSAPAREAVVDYLVADDQNGVRPEVIAAGQNSLKADFIASQNGRKSEIIKNLRLFDATMKQDAEGWLDTTAMRPNARSGSVLLPVEDLLKLEAVAEERYCRIPILSQLLRHKHRSAVEKFLDDLKDSFVYIEIRDRSSPEVIAVLREHVAALKGKARSHAEMLVLLARKDPIPSLLALLDDAKLADKNLVLYELARLADPRAIAPVARLLRTAPPGFFNVDAKRIAQEAAAMESGEPILKPSATFEVRHGLEAIARTKSPDAIAALIELLPVDLARFGTYEDRNTLQRRIAAHLIDLTGESFGVDVDAWRAWQRAQSGAGRGDNSCD